MTANELRTYFNKTYGLMPWPPTFEVDAETYANCCNAVFQNRLEADDSIATVYPDFTVIQIAIGNVSNGLMFKNVELILKTK